MDDKPSFMASSRVIQKEYGETTVQRYELEWRFEGFITSIKNIISESADICGKDFTATDSKWRLSARYSYRYAASSFFDSNVDDTDIDISFHFTRVDEGTSPKFVMGNFGLKKSDGTISEHERYLIQSFVEKDDSCQLFSCTKMILLKRQSHLAPGGALTMTCNLEISDRGRLPSRLVDLSVDLKKLFESKIGCDATLQVKNEIFPVHKIILASRSQVFREMFQETRESYVVDLECDPRAFRDFLLYIYCGETQNSSGDMRQLHWIAHKFGAKQLKEVCAVYMAHDISKDNVIEFGVLGNERKDELLQRKCQEFFQKMY